jgi:hypothetical protein
MGKGQISFAETKVPMNLKGLERPGLKESLGQRFGN